MRAPSERAGVLAAAVWWSVGALTLLVVAAMIVVLDARTAWWTVAGVVVLGSVQASAAACAVVLHWWPRLRGRLDLGRENEILRSIGLVSLAAFPFGLGLGWLQELLLNGSEAPLWTVLLWGAALPVTVPAVLDRGRLRKRYVAAPPPASDVERRAFRTGHRRVGATTRRGHRFGEHPRAQESRAEAIDG